MSEYWQREALYWKTMLAQRMETHDLTKLLKRAVVNLADKTIDHAMEPAEFEAWVKEHYPNANVGEVLDTLGFPDGMPKSIPPWLRIMVRAEKPKIARKKQMLQTEAKRN